MFQEKQNHLILRNQEKKLITMVYVDNWF